ncbi:helix-turn-helix domain-containing protein [Mycolicibacterium brisbanense]
MVKIGQPEVMQVLPTEVPFHDSVDTPGVEVLTFAALTRRARGHGLDPFTPMRPAFHHLVTVTGGFPLHCAVDFTEYELAQHCWLWIRPRQVLQWRPDLADSAGTILLFPSGFLDEATVATAHVDSPAAAPTPVRSSMADRTARLLIDAHRDQTGLPQAIRIEIVRHLLSTLLLHLASTAESSSTDSTNTVFRDFQLAVERDYAHQHRVEDYATDLGYSVRTLTRACRLATGHGAKRVIDNRVLLEAKRLLVHTDLTGTAIGARVGIPDPTMFTKFFRTRTGETPATFRSRVRGI